MDYPNVVAETETELTYATCQRCEHDAMLEHDGHGYCGMHYAEAVGWLTPENVTDKDAVEPIAVES